MGNQQMKLCGGTFFTLIEQFGKKGNVSNPDCLQGLVDIYHVYKPKVIFKDSTRSNGTSLYKRCEKNSTEWLPFENEKFIEDFKDKMLHNYGEALSEITAFVRKNMSADILDQERLVRAVLELIKYDDIDDTVEFYVNPDGSSIKRNVLIEDKEAKYSFPAFLLGIWHYIIVNVQDNTSGKTTIEAWYKGGREKHTKGTFVSDIGKYSFKSVTVIREDEQASEVKMLSSETPVKKVALPKTSSEILNERILASGEVLAKVWGSAIDAMVAGFDKRIIYKSGLIDDEEAKHLQEMPDGIIDLNEEGSVFDTDNRNCIYRYSGDVCFGTKYDEFMNQSVQITADINGQNILSSTTKDNWTTNSIVNNILSAGIYGCVLWFKVLRADEEKAIVQIMTIQEG